MHRNKQWAAVLLAILFCHPSLADIYTIRLTGTLDEILAEDESGSDGTEQFKAALPFGVGAGVVATITYDTDAEDIDSRSGYGRYITEQRVINVGGTIFTAEQLIDIGNDQGRDFLWARNYSSPAFNASGWNWILGGQSIGNDLIDLTDFSESVFDSENLPTHQFDENDFDSLTWAMDYRNSGSESNTLETPIGSFTGKRHRLAGSFTTLQVVPEPNSLLIGVVFILGLGSRRLTRI